jgi:hypothetical protein
MPHNIGERRRSPKPPVGGWFTILCMFCDGLPTPDYMAFMRKGAECNAGASRKYLKAATSPVEMASVIHSPQFYANRPSLRRVDRFES